MEGSIQLSHDQRKTVLSIYRSGSDTRTARRAHLLLLLDDGRSYREIIQFTYVSSETIARVKQRFLEAGVDAALIEAQPPEVVPFWRVVIAGWVLHKTPREFGFFRSRWSCELLSQQLAEQHGLAISPETIRRGLHALSFAWRRPRPVVGPSDPDHEAKLRHIRRLLHRIPDDEVAVFQDEVDVHLNPKIGSQWMLQGQQMTVETPGNNVKQHVAGALVWRTGTLLVSPPAKHRNAELFVAHLDDLRRRLRGFRKIHVILDNAPFHNCRRVRQYLAQWGQRIELHFLPKYAPQTNPIERVWWHLHETITRNHRCRTLEELLDLAYDWFQANNNHYLDMQHTFASAA
jgi:putative transposase